MIKMAKAIIEEAFKDKLDKSGKPYVGHLYRVCQAVAAEGADEELQCIALLHDLLEDCPEWTSSRLLQYFSSRVVEGVEAMTHEEGVPYLEYVRDLRSNPDAVRVKLADLKDNMDMTRLGEVTERDRERMERYEAAWELLTGKKPG